ncbi:hypothetical protein [Aeromicrobium endophyticum]|uniref:hypothetical protein n=1 Tax=Aeromicrobium endophyticum TaxID=2292704 RepID=UPI0011C3F801|nr:hypothetical protein [Aeromicrobium endophyticum]
MRSRASRLVVGAVAAVALGSVALGLASPDGSVGSSDRRSAPTAAGPSAAPASTSPATSASTPPARGPDLAPDSARGTWPGAPRGVVGADGTIDWCRAITTSGASEAIAAVGREAVDAAACAAVRFAFEHRYSRLSLPRRTYAPDDFDSVVPALDPRTVADVYRPRITRFVADPDSRHAGEQLGLVLFAARDTPRGAAHASAGNGHVFYGPAFSARGYAGRAVWTDPTWSTVAIGLDRSTTPPRIEARLTASASLPVWSTTARRDAVLTVPTRATFVLDGAGGDGWRISGWTISRGRVAYGRPAER